jgi:Sec-independent protein translocase protein TatA
MEHAYFPWHLAIVAVVLAVFFGNLMTVLN